jgi:hypothetical protein
LTSPVDCARVPSHVRSHSFRWSFYLREVSGPDFPAPCFRNSRPVRTVSRLAGDLSPLYVKKDPHHQQRPDFGILPSFVSRPVFVVPPESITQGQGRYSLSPLYRLKVYRPNVGPGVPIPSQLPVRSHTFRFCPAFVSRPTFQSRPRSAGCGRLRRPWRVLPLGKVSGPDFPHVILRGWLSDPVPFRYGSAGDSVPIEINGSPPRRG